MPDPEIDNETFSALSDALILQQIADRKGAERDEVLKGASLKEILRSE